MERVEFVILGTYSYFPLAVRLIKKLDLYFTHEPTSYRLMCNEPDPERYFSDELNSVITFSDALNDNWVQACHMKYPEVLKSSADYIYYMDADTDVRQEI